tara:strand:+ start:259 stop:507 length:249 start_codon:yes stop_codon:yes gene_type:complete
MKKNDLDWVIISSYGGNIDAEMAKGVLSENKIPSYIKSDFFGSAYHLNAFNISAGSVKLFTPKNHEKKALELLESIGLLSDS